MSVISEGALSRLTDEELLSHVDDRRHLSPIIAELAKRLEALLESDRRDDYNNRAECPVCQATLHVDFDQANNLFNVKPWKES